MRILILGGYGAFGGRLARLLSDCEGLELLIGGRSRSKAEAFCRSYKGAARVTPLRIDRAVVDTDIAHLRLDLVVDASGPFQNYGENRYRVIETAIRLGIDYIDFSDGADFVSGVSQLDAAATEKGVFALSGASSFPVLSAAVLTEMEKTIAIRDVSAGVGPSPHATVGINVVRALLGYSGRSLEITRNGETVEADALTETKRYTIAPPGRLPMHNRHFSLIDVPDLRVLPKRFETIENVWVGAGPIPEIMHKALNLVAKVRARFGLFPLQIFAPIVHRMLNLARIGEDRGGMFVEGSGRDATGNERTLSWHLLAEGDAGPQIPALPIEGIVRKLIAGERPEPGARSAAGALTLSDFAPLFQSQGIMTGWREEGRAPSPIFRTILGSALDTLPDPVRAFHDESRSRTWKGEANVRTGSGILARIVARIIGLPPANDRVQVEVRVDAQGDSERWTRRFGTHELVSVLWPGTGRHAHLMNERFGQIEVALAMVVDEDRLRFVPRHWSIFGVPLPKTLIPSAETFETEKEGRFVFDVTFRVPFVGFIASYTGWLKPAQDEVRKEPELQRSQANSDAEMRRAG